MDNVDITENLKSAHCGGDGRAVAGDLNYDAFLANPRRATAHEGAYVQYLHSLFGRSAGDADEEHLTGYELPILSSVALYVYDLHTPLKLTGKKLNVVIRADDGHGNVVDRGICGHSRYTRKYAGAVIYLYHYEVLSFLCCHGLLLSPFLGT